MWFTDPATSQAELVGIYAGDVELLQGASVLETYGYGIAINATFCSWISDYVLQQDPGAMVSCGAAQDAPPDQTIPACGTGLMGVMPLLLAAWACAGRFSGRMGKRRSSVPSD